MQTNKTYTKLHWCNCVYGESPHYDNDEGPKLSCEDGVFQLSSSGLQLLRKQIKVVMHRSYAKLIRVF